MYYLIIFLVAILKFEYILQDDSKFYRYEAVMFNGVRSFDFKNGAILECMIVACTSDKFSSCSERLIVLKSWNILKNHHTFNFQLFTHRWRCNMNTQISHLNLQIQRLF